MIPDWVVIILVILVGGLTVFFIPTFLTRRAINQVIRIFQRHYAVGSGNAKTIDELGLRPPSLWRRMMHTRDYKPRALDILTRAKIVRTTEDDKLYLSEEDFALSRFYKQK